MKLRIGLVGLGEGRQIRHGSALRALADRFEVRAVYDQVAHRAEMTASEFQATAVDGYGALALRDDVDAILVLSTQWFGSKPVLAACRSGKAVYLGGGVDVTLEEAQSLGELARQKGVVVMCEFPRRQSPATLRLKELIATRLGQPQLIFCHHRLPLVGTGAPGSAVRRGSKTTRELVELVDWCRYAVGSEPRWVTGMMYREEGTTGGKDYQMMSLDFSVGPAPGAGPVAQISCGRYIPGRWSEALTYRPLAAMQVSCENGIAFVDLPSTLIWFDEAGRHQESLEAERPVGEQLLMQFYHTVTGSGATNCSLEDACRALEIVEAARKSYRKGRRIEL